MVPKPKVDCCVVDVFAVLLQLSGLKIVPIITITRKGMIVWKSGTNWPF